MYRIKSVDDTPLLACDFVFGRYARNDIESLHEKNLYLLGEDRMLTTLLLMHFPDMKLSFVPEAVCWTITPHTFRILLSQRRRWINSTFHNMLELLKVNSMCGICFCSMKTVVIADMISTMILPASLLYAAYFIYLVIVLGEPISQTIFIVYGIIIGCQVVVFMVRSRWDYFFWFLLYLVLGIPIFFFLLPLYSFWNMDDLSWGQTRQVQTESNTPKIKSDTPKMHVHKSVAKGSSKTKSSDGSPTSRSTEQARNPRNRSSLKSDHPKSRGNHNNSSVVDDFAEC